MAATKMILNNVPGDIYDFLLKQQAKIKLEKKKGVFGLEKTIYSLLRDCKRCEEKEEKAA